MVDTDDVLHVCTTHYDKDSETEAMNEGAETHDHALYATTGCNGFSFSAVTKKEFAEPPVDCPPGCVPEHGRRARRSLLFASLPVECPMGCVQA